MKSTALKLIAMICSLLVYSMALQAQGASEVIDVADRALHVAKQIKRLIVKQLKDPEGAAGSDTRRFEIIAKDRNGTEIDVPLDEAKKLYSWTGKSKSGELLQPKGVLERIEDQKGSVKRARNILRLVDNDAAVVKKLEVHIAEKYTSYSSAVGASKVTAKGGSWFAQHPVLAVGGGVVAVGGGVAAAGGGGGGDDDSSSGSGSSSGGSSSASGSPFQGSLSGTLRGVAIDDEQLSGSFSVTISESGSVSGTFVATEESGTLSGSVDDSGNVSMSMYLSGEGTVGSWRGQFTKSGTSMSASGTWTEASASGTWSGSGTSTAP